MTQNHPLVVLFIFIENVVILMASFYDVTFVIFSFMLFIDHLIKIIYFIIIDYDLVYEMMRLIYVVFINDDEMTYFYLSI
jgi:hypothetical protein